MDGKKFIVCVFAVIMIGAGFLSATVFAESKTKSVTAVVESKPEYMPRVLKWVSFPGGGKASYEVDAGNGRIQNFFYEDGKLIKPSIQERPHWLVKGKEWVGSGCFTDSQCGPAFISIKTRKGTPIEYWTVVNNIPVCIGAYDPSCPAWYQPCYSNPDDYPNCDK